MPLDDYWKSPDGIRRRVNMLGEDFTFRVVNNSLQVYGKKNEASGFEWVGSIDERTCNYCDSQIGRQYRLGQFLPRLPAHGGCRCGWRIIPQEEPMPKLIPKEPEIKHSITLDPEIKNPKELKIEFDKILNELPPHHIRKDLEFRVIKENPYSPYGQFDGSTISMREDALKSEKGRHVVYHEIGHGFYYDRFDYAQQMRWMDEWSAKLDKMPTDLAKSRFEEGFAECYALYQSDKKTLDSSIVSWFDTNLEK